MLKSILIFLIFGIFSIYKILHLGKEKMNKEILLFTILMTIATISAIAQINNISIPNPLEHIASIIEPVNKLFP